VVRVIVVLVDFSDKHMTQTAAHFQQLFFSTGVIPTKSVREYYTDVTHGIIDIQGQVVGPFRMPQTLAAYAHGASGVGRHAAERLDQWRGMRLLPPTRPSTSRRSTTTATGFVDAFIVIHAGAGGEVTGNSGDIWSHKWTLAGGAKTVDGTKVFGYLTGPRRRADRRLLSRARSLAVWISDLYDTDGHLGRNRQLVPDGGRKLGRWRQYPSAPVCVVQGEPRVGVGRQPDVERPNELPGRKDVALGDATLEGRCAK
jgi:immune inhibitor A